VSSATVVSRPATHPRPAVGITSTPLTADPPRGGPTRNVVLNEAYAQAVIEAGGLPLVLPIAARQLVPALLGRIDALILSGGGDVDPARYGERAVEQVGGVDSARDEWELALVSGALDERVPVLAICRGMQVLNVARGGTLIQDLPSMARRAHRDDELRDTPAHPLRLDTTSELASVLGLAALHHPDLATNSLHHQAVDRVGSGLRATAWADDDTIEAIETVDGQPVLGVQWHPELLGSHPPHARLFEWLVRCALPRSARVRTGGGQEHA
jgi:putative glutamine amidotransferase